jgi:outer membrane protein TolC
LEQDRALLPPLRGQLAAARHALALLVGHAPADWTAPNFTLAELNLAAPVPVALPSALVRKRPTSWPPRPTCTPPPPTSGWRPPTSIRTSS